ncbi:hypothetical protein, partial [Pseudomonas nitroreducens]|uniref:hypothetical protein n=1 Tax=Pseudomonas nitroreducens TaxID=46680 RepID=UPI003813B8F7
PIPNSVVKRRIADGSVEFLHVRVGHRQAPIPRPLVSIAGRGFCFCAGKRSPLDMEALITTLILLGVLSLSVGQLLAFFLLLTRAGPTALLALIIPGFGFFLGRRHGIYKWLLLPYLACMGCFIAAMIVAG